MDNKVNAKNIHRNKTKKQLCHQALLRIVIKVKICSSILKQSKRVPLLFHFFSVPSSVLPPLQRHFYVFTHTHTPSQKHTLPESVLSLSFTRGARLSLSFFCSSSSSSGSRDVCWRCCCCCCCCWRDVVIVLALSPCGTVISHCFRVRACEICLCWWEKECARVCEWDSRMTEWANTKRFQSGFKLSTCVCFEVMLCLLVCFDFVFVSPTSKRDR